MTDALAELAQVQASYLEVALDEIIQTWGPVAQYLESKAGMDRALLARLQARLLD